MAAIVIAGLVSYHNAINGEFVWDDMVLIKDNMYIRSFAHLDKVFTRGIGEGAGVQSNSYRPLQIVSYMVGYALWGADVRGYHLLNILCHICVAIGIFWLSLLIFKDRLISFFTGLLFVVHPIHTGAVTYISGGADSAAAVFMIVCSIFYIRSSLRQSSEKININNYIIVIISYAAALLTRENSLILPIILLLYHYTFKRKINTKLFFSLVVIAVGYCLLRITFLKDMLSAGDSVTTMWRRIPGFFVAITRYLKLLIAPVNLHMEYGNKLFSVFDPKCIMGIFLSLFLLVVAVMKRKNTFLFFSIMCFFVTILPVSNIYPLNAYMAQHWLYLPSIGFFLIAAKIISVLFKGRKQIIIAVVISLIIVGACSFLTIKQNRYWRDSVTLYQQTLKYASSSRLYNNLGVAYKERGDFDKALEAYGIALKLNSKDAYIYNNIGLLYSSKKDFQKAFKFYTRAIEIDPNYAQGFYNLGNIYMYNQDYGKAISAYEKAIKNNPFFAGAYCNLGIIHTYTRDNDKALFFLRKAVEINPYDADAYYNLGNIYVNFDRDQGAVAAYRKAIKNNSSYAEAYNNLAVIYLRKNNFKLAGVNYKKAKELGITNPVLEKALKDY